MYDYYFSEKKKIKKNPEDFILFVKKLLPKSCNSFPDSQIIRIFRYLKKNKINNMIETGTGSSTICFFMYAYLYKKNIYSFDIDQHKLSIVRQVINESICKPLNINLYDYWISVSSDSTSKYSGIACLKEKKEKFDFLFLDSEHTHEHVLKELNSFLELNIAKYSLVLDDSYMKYIKYNNGYINNIRLKLGLSKIQIKNNLSKNTCAQVVENFLKSRGNKFKKEKNIELKRIKNDIYFHYFGADVKYSSETTGKNFILDLTKSQKSDLINRVSIYKVF